MSRSRWLGAEPRSFTTYEYDDDGRLAAAVTQREPEWTDEDRAWHLAYLREQASVCSGCGHHVDECRDPETAGRWRVVHQTCEACRVAEADAENRAEDGPGKHRGLYAGVVLDC